jgi:hypothetical protein
MCFFVYQFVCWSVFMIIELIESKKKKCACSNCSIKSLLAFQSLDPKKRDKCSLWPTVGN